MSVRAQKKDDLIKGALRVFARDGYARAGIDALAREAGVSTRTIYNQYGDKAGLFRAVILESANHVAEHEIGLADQLLGHIGDLREDLVRFGMVWVSADPETALHFELVRHIRADESHIDPATLSQWQQAGPIRVRRALAAHLERLAQGGYLSITDPETAAIHLVQLTAGVLHEAPTNSPAPLIRSGVDVFLAAYGRTPTVGDRQGQPK